jgi:hypothetical protein
MTDRLADRLTERLTDRLADSLTDSLTDRLTDRLTDCLTDFLLFPLSLSVMGMRSGGGQVLRSEGGVLLLRLPHGRRHDHLHLARLAVSQPFFLLEGLC